MLLAKLIQNFIIFRGLEPKTLLVLAEASKINYYKKGTIFYDSFHMERPYFYYITKGWAKLFSVSFEGEEIIKDIVTDTDHFNEDRLFTEDIEPLSAQAISDIQVIMTPIALLREWLGRDKQLALNLLNESLHKQRELTHEIEHLSIQNAAQRIGCFLLRLCNNEESGAITINLPYDKVLLARRLGMRPETFSRALTKLSQQCHIRVEEACIHIAKTHDLMDYVCRQCSLVYPCQERGHG